jgi:transcriptional regulator with XRE-family HTH domain
MSKTADYQAERTQILASFGANVRRLREAREPAVSQERLAVLTGLHRTEIGKIEQGKVEPYLTTLMALAHGLGASLDDLVLGIELPAHRRPWPQARSST